LGYKGHLVIDADCHMQEYWDVDRTYREFIDPKYKATYEAFSQAVRADQKRLAETGHGLGSGTSAQMGAVYSHPPLRPLGVYEPFEVVNTPRSPSGLNRDKIDLAVNWDPALYLTDMDKAGIDIGVIFSSQSDNYCMLQDVGFEHALNEAYHRYMHVFCAESGGRLRWLSNTVIRDVAASVADLTYWAERDETFAGAFVPRRFPEGRLLDSPDLFPLWERSQELDLPIWIHGNPDHAPTTPGSKELDNSAFARSVLKGWGGQTALGALIGGGIFDLFPRLRLGVFENAAGWMPWFIEMCDWSYRPGAPSTPNMKRTPSEVVADGQIFCGVEPGELGLGECVARLGEHPWLFATDYPHLSGPWPDGVAQIDETVGLSESAKIAMFETNAQRFLPRLRSA
jgi:predicted TIM-barrel fold metal-dependent hydrolase